MKPVYVRWKRLRPGSHRTMWHIVKAERLTLCGWRIGEWATYFAETPRHSICGHCEWKRRLCERETP